jgi:drug/metabolite transporter (DMT)-like permease
MTDLFQSLLGSPFRGEIMAVAAGLVWAVAVLLFRTSGRAVHPLGLNLFKTVLGTLLLAVTLLAAGQPFLPGLPWQSYALLAASGVIGITVSDTLFFACLNRLGAGLTAVVDCVNIPFIILFSFLFIGERLTLWQLLGVSLIILAILLVSGKRDAALPPRRDLIPGIGLGVLAMLTMAAGIVMIKPILHETPIVWATLLRVGSAAVVLAVLVLANPRRRPILRPLRTLANWRSMVPATFLGSYAALIAWMAGMKYTQASVAAPLSQLNSVFIFVLAAIFLKEKVTGVKTAAVVLATVGAVMVSWLR